MIKLCADDEPLAGERSRRASADRAIGVPEIKRSSGARLVQVLRASPLRDLDFDTAPFTSPVRNVDL